MSAIITIARVLVPDTDHGRPDENDEGFWPSHDPDAAGFVTPEMFDAEHAKAFARMRGWEEGAWHFVGVVARATIKLPYGAAFIIATLDSPGIWGIESDADDVEFAEVFEDERATLLDMLENLRSFTVEA